MGALLVRCGARAGQAAAGASLGLVRPGRRALGFAGAGGPRGRRDVLGRLRTRAAPWRAGAWCGAGYADAADVLRPGTVRCGRFIRGAHRRWRDVARRRQDVRAGGGRHRGLPRCGHRTAVADRAGHVDPARSAGPGRWFPRDPAPRVRCPRAGLRADGRGPPDVRAGRRAADVDAGRVDGPRPRGRCRAERGRAERGRAGQDDARRSRPRRRRGPDEARHDGPGRTWAGTPDGCRRGRWGAPVRAG